VLFGLTTRIFNLQRAAIQKTVITACAGHKCPDNLS
jgi:hypothetical protein